ncbi:hypothetical protein J2S53_002923 [Actinopolyspora lacussalsi]|nr:hypothetical protein [Actinopolyspora lacussalsi]
MTVPGLLQAPELPEDEAVRRTELRLARQRVLDREGTPLELTTLACSPP